MARRLIALLVNAIWLLLVAQRCLSADCNIRYHISEGTFNWHRAVEYCNQLGLRLAILDTQAKQDEAMTFARSTGIQSSGFFGLWLGATDLGETKVYRWQATGLPVKWTNWKTGEPSGGNEHCMNMYYWPKYAFEWTWNDAPCTDQMYALCQTTYYV